MRNIQQDLRINTYDHKDNFAIHTHPCFAPEAHHHYARIHLPVAPKCNVQCKFCNRAYSCVNESRPGVTAEIISPKAALDRLREAITVIPHLSVAGIAGPGDPFANPDETLETLRLIRKEFPNVMLCISTNGLNILPFVDELKALQVTHITITVNAVTPEIGEQIYDWISYDGGPHAGTRAAYRLWDYQQLAIQALTFRKILVKVNTVCIPGINSDHIDTIAATIAPFGVAVHNVIPLIPVAGTAFEHIPEPTAAEMYRIRQSAARYLPQMQHCARCRADAAGLLSEKTQQKWQKGTTNEGESNDRTNQELCESDTLRFVPTIPFTSASGINGCEKHSLIAVATSDGLLVNMHLGQARTLRIYRTGTYRPEYIEDRALPDTPFDSAQLRWETVADKLSDCTALLVSGIGPIPHSILSTRGIRVYIIEDFITDILSPQRMAVQQSVLQMNIKSNEESKPFDYNQEMP